MDFKTLKSELLKLNPSKRAFIYCKLLLSRKKDKMKDIEDIWIDEAIERYRGIKKRETAAIDSDLVINEAKLKYK